MEQEAGLRNYLEVKDLGAKGYEVVVSLVNESEEPASIVAVEVEVHKDGVPTGRHRVTFPGRHPEDIITLNQFEIAEGHFHLAPESRAKELRFKVAIDCRVGDEDGTRQISRRIATGKFARRQK